MIALHLCMGWLILLREKWHIMHIYENIFGASHVICLAYFLVLEISPVIIWRACSDILSHLKISKPTIGHANLNQRDSVECLFYK